MTEKNHPRLRSPSTLASFIMAGTALCALVVALLVMGSGGRYLAFAFRRLLFVDLLLVPFFAAAILLAMVLHRREAGLVSFIETLGRRPVLAGVVTFLALGAVAPFVYRLHPLSMDEVAAYFQSKVFAAGKLTGNFPVSWMPQLIPPFFQGMFLIPSPVTGDVISAYFPGFALLMAPFTALGLAWLCNPVLTAATVWATAHTMRLLQPSRPEAAGWAVAFTICSPAVLSLGVSYYAMPALLLANLIYTWGFFNPRPSTMFWTGVAGSIALTLHNPFPHILFALPWMVWLIRSRGWGRDLAALIAGYLPLGLLLGLGWMMLRGEVTVDTHAAGATSVIQLLLSLARKAFVLPEWPVIVMRAAGFAKLWLWAVPGLIILAALGWWRDRGNVYVSLMAASALLTFVGYFAVPFDQGHGWGYRYFHSAWFVLPLLAASYLTGLDGERAKSAKLFASALLAASMLLIVPAYLYATRSFVSLSVDSLPTPGSSGPLRITFINPRQGNDADLVANDPFLRGDDLYLLGAGPEADAKTARALSPEAQMVGRTPVATMWHVPNPPEGTKELLRKTPPPK